MSTPGRLAIPLAIAILSSAACSPSPHQDPAHGRWTGLAGDVRIQWTSASGLDLASGISLPVRAYLESYSLVQFTGQLGLAYPGFTEAVPPNNNPDASGDSSSWDRRPGVNAAVTSPLSGNIHFNLQSVESTGSEMTVTVCKYNYALGKKQPDGTFVQLPTNGPAEERGIVGVLLRLVPPRNGQQPNLPPQVGASLAPEVDVFDGWQITGYRTTTGSSRQEWPTKVDVEASCRRDAPDSLERRQTLLGGPHPASTFPMSSPTPGWPDSQTGNRS